MATRGQIAKVENDATGRYIYLSHASHPSESGSILLEHYQDPAKVDQLLDLGSIPYIEDEIEDIMPYYGIDSDTWEDCRATEFTGGTDAYFLRPWILAPEWLYCWTPDGWLASPVERCHLPRNFMTQLSVLSPEEFQDWFDNNQEPEWIAWRALCTEYQQPKPLATVIEEHPRP